MVILVTGGTGFIGSHTVVELINKNYDCLIIDNLINSKREVVDKLAEITNKKISFEEVDLLDKNKLENIFINNKIDCIIHFAGLKAVAESITMPVKYYNNNIISTLNLLELMNKYSVKKIIFSSSATVYGDSIVPMKEEYQIGIGITNPYGRTKYMIELILQDYYISNPDANVISLRYFNPIGAHSSGLIGENPQDIPNNIMPFLSKVAIQNNTNTFIDKNYNELKIFGNNYNTRDGSCIRDYIHVVDLARAHVCAYENLQKGYDAINIGTGKGTSVFELVNAFEKINNIKIPTRIVDRRAGDITECYCEPLKAKEKLGWIAEKTIEDSCKDVWNYLIKNMK